MLVVLGYLMMNLVVDSSRASTLMVRALVRTTRYKSLQLCKLVDPEALDEYLLAILLIFPS